MESKMSEASEEHYVTNKANSEDCEARALVAKRFANDANLIGWLI